MLLNNYIDKSIRLILERKLLLFFFLLLSFVSNSQVNVTAAALTTSGDPYPSDGMCPASTITIQVKVVNNGASSLNLALKPVTVDVTISGAINQSFSTVVNSGTISVGGSKYVNVSTTADFSSLGSYTVDMSATCTGDASPGIDATEVVGVTGNTITLTSANVTTSQSICLNSPIVDITYDVSDNATDATASGLPAGLTATFVYPTLTISGSPSANDASPYSYSVTATGVCPATEDMSLAGTITVVSLPTISVTGATEICIASTTTLSPNAGGTWTSSDPAVATVDNAGLVTGISAGSVTFTFNDLGTGCSNTTVTPIVVSAPPTTGVLSGTQAICVASTTTFSSTVAGGSWSSADALIASVVSGTGVITGVGAGTINMTYTVTGTGGCSDATDTRSVTVTAPPDPGVLSGTQAICNPGTSIFSSTVPGGSWTSGTPGVATIDIAGNIAAVSAGTSTMSYTVSGSGGCADVAGTLDVTVTDPPITGILSGTQLICETGTSTFTSTVAGGTWVSADPSVATIDLNSGAIDGISAGSSVMTYTVTGTGGCTDVSDDLTLTVSALPDPGILSGTNAICLGDVSTFSSTVAGGAWSSASPAVATIDANTGAIASLTVGASIMSYTVTGVNECAGFTNADTRTLTVTAPPDAGSLSGNQDICADGSTTFVPTVVGGLWSTSDPAIATVVGGLVSGVSGGTAAISYTITGTGGCADVSTTRDVNVTAIPTAGTLSGPQEVCVSGSSTFASDVPGGTWTTNDPTIATITAGGSIGGVSAGSAIMTYTVTGTGGCSDVSDTRSVTVSNAPSAGALSGTQIICANGTTTFTSTVAGGAWSSGTPAVATIDPATGAILGVSAGTSVMTYTITGTGGCSDVTNTRTVTVKANPTVSPIVGSSSLCIGDNVIYTNATNGGTWSSSDPLIINIDNFGSASALAEGNSILTYSVTSNGCTTAVTLSVDVFDVPTVQPIAGSTTVCAGSNITLTDVTPGGTWSTDDNSIATVVGGVVTGVAAGTTNINYAVTTNGCTTTQSVAVTVVALPTVAAIAGTNTVCEGSDTQLSIITGGGTWSSADPTTATVDASGLVTGVTAGSVLITYTKTSGGCSNSSSVNITVLPSPSVNPISGSSSICIGDFTTLNNTTPGGVWSSDNYGVADISVAGVVEGISAGTCNLLYSVTSGGCTTDQTFAMTVNDFPVVPSISGSSFVCVSSTTPLSNAVAGGAWSSSDITKATINSTTGVVTGVASGSSTITYAVTTNGCTTTKTFDVTVNTIASLGAISGSNSICAGTNTTLTNATAGGTWTSSNLGVATIDPASGIVSGVSAGSSTITYAIASGGCNASTTFTLTVLAVPSVNAITGPTEVCTGNSITLANTTAGGTWSSSDDAIATINSSGVLLGVSAGSVNAIYSKTSGGCTTSVTYGITVSSTPSIQPITGTTTLCLGQSTTLASTTVGGTWSSGSTGVVTINSSSGAVATVSAGSSVITYSLTIGSCSNSVNTTVTVNAMPTVQPISGSSSLCVGDNITLTNATAGGAWSSSNMGAATIDAITGVALGVAAGSTTISYSVTTNGCTTTQTQSVTVNSYPTVAATSGTATVCEGSTVTLTNGTPGGVWSTQNNLIATTNAFGLVTGVSAGTTNIDYTVTSNGCASVASFSVTVDAALSVSSIIGTTDICIGANSQLTNATNGGTWSSSNTGVATVNSSGLVTSVSVGTTTIRYDVVTNGVCPQFSSVTFTVNQIPTVNSISDISVCQGGSVSAINFTGTGSPVYNWTNTNTTIGLAAIGTGDISSFTASGTSIGSASEIAVIDVTPVANGCSGTSKQFLITVNSLDNAGFNYSSSSYCYLDADPSPSITGLLGGTFAASSNNLVLNTTTGVVDISASTPGYYQITYTTNGSCSNDSIIDFAISAAPTLATVSDQSVCDGSNFSAINFSGAPGTIFTWTNDNTSIGLAASGSGNISAFTATGTSVGGSSITSKVIVTPISGSCIGIKDTFLLTVNSKDNPSFTYPSTTFCSTLDPNPVANITGKTGGVFTMLPGGATLNANTGLITLSSTPAGSYTLTYTTNGTCVNTNSIDLTIGSNPSVNAITSQSICSGSSFNSVNFTGTAGTSYNWTSSNPALIGLAASGTGDIASFIGSGASVGTPNVTSTITVTPKIGSCTGASKTFTLAVKYKDDVAITYSESSYCTSNTNPSPSISGTSGGAFSSTPVGLILNSTSGLIDIGASAEGLYTVKYITSGTCGDTAIATVGINNSPAVNNVADQTVCSGNNFADINFTGTTGTVYNWTNSNTAIGLAASGTGDILSFASTNSTSAQISSVITITPKSGACTGAVKTFNLKVNPSEDATYSYSSSSVCQTNPSLTPVITGTTNGTFSSSAGLSINASTGVVNVSTSTPGTYNVVYRTPGTCFDVKSISLTINATPVLNSLSNASACQNAMFDPISFTGTVGATYNWTNSNSSIGLASSGSGNIASFMAAGTTLGSSPISSVITVSPSLNGCSGVAKTMILTTNSIDNPAFSYSSSSFCLTESNPTPTISGKSGGTFSVLPNNGLALDANSGTIDLSSSTAGTYNITYTTNGFCTNDSTVSISIGSFPSVTAVTSQSVCNNSNFTDIIFSGASGTVFSWTNSNTAIGLAASGTGNISSFKAEGAVIGGATISSTVVVTPLIGTCTGTPVSFTLSVKPLDNANFSYSNSSYCKTQANPSATITGLTGGTFTSSPIGLSMNSVGTINLATSTSGDYVVSYTTHGQCPNVSTYNLSIGSNPTINPISDQSICAGASFSKIDFTGNEGTVFNWTNNNTATGLAASGTGDINAFTAQNAGTSIVVVTPIIGTCAGTSKTFTLTVNSIQSSSIQYGQSSYCTSDSDPTPIQTGPSNGLYSSSPAGLSIDASTGLISLAQSIAGNYTVNYVLSASCSTSSSTTISVGSAPSINTINAQSVCNGASFSAISFSGSPGSQFNWVNSNTGIGLGASGSGNIAGFVGVNNTNSNIVSTITVTPIIGSCIGTGKSFTLTIKPTDNPTFSYSSSNICHNDSDPTPIISGTNGGSFSFSPSGLSLNSSSGKIDVGSSSAGNYNITYLTSGTCPAASTKSVTINALPFVNTVSIAAKCQGSTFNAISFNGSTNTTFSWINSNTAIGLIASGTGILPSFTASGTTKNGPAISGIVTVTPSINGCLGSTMSFPLTVNSLDDASFKYSKNSICQNDVPNPVPTIQGTTGGVFTSNPAGLSLNSSTGRISIGVSTIGTYNVTYTTSGSCPDDSTISVVINPQPSVNSISPQQRCFGDSFNPIAFTGTSNTLFNWTNTNSNIGLASSGVGDIAAFVAKGTVFGGSAINGTITITPEINGCFGSTTSFVLTVNPIDNPAFHYSDNSFCTTQADPTPTIDGTLGGGFTFTPVGLSINTSTGLINLNASTAGTYQIKYTTPGLCMDDSTVTIGIGSNPSVNDVDDQSYCQGDMFDDVIFTGNPGTMFNWINSNTSVGLAASGIGNITGFKANGTTNGGADASATITVTPRIGTCIGTNVNYKYKVRANPNIVASITGTTKKDTSFCKGGSVVLNATGASKNENYIWTPHTSLSGNNGIGATVTTKTDTTQQYIVRGQSQFGCFNYDTLLVNVFNPQVYHKNDTTLCAGSIIDSIVFKGNLPGTTFNWSNSNGTIGLGFNGVNKISSFTAKNTSANKQTATISVTPSYLIQALNTTCNGPVMKFSIAVNKQDDPTFSGYQAQYCANEILNTKPTISGVQGGVFTSNPSGLALNSNTGEIFPNSSKAGSYAVKYTTNGTCPKSDSVFLFINPLITASISGADTVCVNAVSPQIKFKGANGVAPYTFSYKVNGGVIQTIATDPGKDEVTIPVSTSKAGIFSYELVGVEESSSSKCSNLNVFGIQSVIVNDLPKAQITSTSSTVCAGATNPEIRITGINGVSPFTFTYFISKDGNPFGTSQTVSTQQGEYLAKIPVGTTEPGSYNYTVNIVKNGDDLSCSNNINISTVITVKPLPTASLVTKPNSICMNGDANVEFTATNGLPPFTIVYSVNDGGAQTIKSSNNAYTATLKAITSASGVYSYKILSVSDADVTSCQNLNVNASAILTITPGTKVDKIQDINVCVNDLSDTIEFTGGPTGTVYNWVSNNTTIGLAGTGKGDIYPFKSKNTSGSSTNIARITVVPSLGQCKGDTMKFDVVVRPKPKAKIIAPNNVCPGDSFRLEGVGSELKYIWTPNVSCITCNPVIAKPTENTTYKAFVTDKYNCYDSTEHFVYVYRKPEVLVDDQVLCGVLDSVMFKGKGDNMTYNYSDGILDGVLFMPNIGVSKYLATVTDNNGCKNTDTVKVSVVDNPKSIFTATPETGLASDVKPLNVLLTNKSTNAVDFEWYFRNGDASPLIKTTTEPVTALYKKPGIYVVTLVAKNGGCIDSSSFSLKIEKLDTPRVEIAPNVFTPDNDGINDVFFLTVKNAKNIHITIFNRWGNPIHEITETTQSWDGRINGKDADEGVYYYRYEIEGSSGEKIKGQGYVQLIRH
jgi:gliding motility-associated-like protein